MRSSGTFQTPMPLAEKPARRWNRIAATRRSARRSRIDSRCSKSCAWETPSSAAGGRERLGRDLHRALRRADHGQVELRQLDRLRLPVVDGLRRGRQHLGALLHLQVHPDLEEPQRRQLAHRLGARQLLEQIQRAVEAQRRARLGGDREPEVEVVVAQVVVRHARVRVDDLGRPPGVLGIDLRRHQHRAVAEHSRVEDRRDLADDALVQQALGSGQNLLLGHACELRHVLVGSGGDREAALEQVEELAVELVERDRRPVLSAPNLRYRLSHLATSFAW